VNRPDLRLLADELWFVVGEYGAVSASASFITADGLQITLQVTAGGLATLEDDAGHLVGVPGLMEGDVLPKRKRPDA
jgi:hypothetical protein